MGFTDNGKPMFGKIYALKCSKERGLLWCAGASIGLYWLAHM